MIFIRTRTKTHGFTELQSKWYCEIKLSLKFAATYQKMVSGRFAYQEMVSGRFAYQEMVSGLFLPFESEKIEPVNRLRPKGNYSLIS